MKDANDPGQTVQQGESYDHSEHGKVKVLRIWNGVHQVDRAGSAEKTDVVVVRYLPGEDGEHINELTATLDEFRDAIE